jgi:putative FmdB family regulatory protein
MPLYEYECDDNHHRFEVIQKFSDPPVEKCRVCGSPVHKLFSSPAIQFKGSGWYITDYAKKDSAAAGRSGGSKDDGGTKDSGTNDSAAKESGKKDGGSDAPASSTSSTESSKTDTASKPATSTKPD